MKKCLALLLAALLLAPALASAGTVMTSFYPVWLLAVNLTDGIEDIEVLNLASPETGCLHDYQLTAGDMRALSTADVFLINGAGMESYLDNVFEALPDLPVVDASRGIDLLPSDTGETEHNPHIWLDPRRAAQMVTNLADGLMTAFPEHAEAIAANRDAYLARLEALDAELREGLSGLPRRDIVTFHEAFAYFADAYGLNVAAVIAREPGDALSPRELADLVTTVRSLGAPPLFTEPQYTDIAAQTVARETGASVWQLDPCVTGPDADVPLTYYEDVMRANMGVLQEALK